MRGSAKVLPLKEYNVFVVETLGTHDVKNFFTLKVHASPLLHYSKKDLNVTEELEAHVLEEEDKLHFVEVLLSFKEGNVLVRRVGCEEPSWPFENCLVV